MWVANKRPHYLNYSVNKKGPKSGQKVKNTIIHWGMLMRRLEVEGETKWLVNARKLCLARLKKYSIDPASINA